MSTVVRKGSILVDLRVDQKVEKLVLMKAVKMVDRKVDLKD